jgi:cytochrome P450
MRFGQLEVRTIATLILARFTLSLPADFELAIRQMPTISPKHGLPMDVHPRACQTAPQLSAVGVPSGLSR